MRRLELNYDTYPLVVGAADKYEFRDWENCGSSVELKAFYQDEASDGYGLESPAKVVWNSSDEENVTVSQEGVARA